MLSLNGFMYTKKQSRWSISLNPLFTINLNQCFTCLFLCCLFTIGKCGIVLNVIAFRITFFTYAQFYITDVYLSLNRFISSKTFAMFRKERLFPHKRTLFQMSFRFNLHKGNLDLYFSTFLKNIE